MYMKLYDQRDIKTIHYKNKIFSLIFLFALCNANRYVNKRIRTLYTSTQSLKCYQKNIIVHGTFNLDTLCNYFGLCDILAVVRPFFSSLSLPRRSGGMHDNTRHRTW